VFDPANPHKNVADNLTDVTPLREYAAHTLADMKKSMAVQLHRFVGDAQLKVATMTADADRQRRVLALMSGLLRMEHSAERIIKLPELDKMSAPVEAFAPLGPFIFRFVASVLSVPSTEQYYHQSVTKYLQLSVHVDVALEWLELQSDLLRLGQMSWPALAVGFQFQRQRVWSTPVSTTLSPPASVKSTQNYQITKADTKVTYAQQAHLTHSLAFRELHSCCINGALEVKCAVSMSMYK
jgi:hypothetical protein